MPRLYGHDNKFLLSIMSYYGPDIPTTISFLEFGSIDLAANKKNVWEFQLHDKAYDWLMLARYANDLVAYLRLKDRLGQEDLKKLADLYAREVHHKNDASGNLSKLSALMAVNNVVKPAGSLSFFELGQTIFGCIEGMEFYLRLLDQLGYRDLTLDLREVDWFGMDISAFFNTLCVLMHEKYRVTATDRLESFTYPKDVFFAKGVTLLYACQSAAELIQNLNRGKISVFDYSFARTKEARTSIGTGKQVVYPTLASFHDLYRQSGKQFYVRVNKSSYNAETDRLWVDGVYGDETLCREFIRLDTAAREMMRLQSNADALVFADLSPQEKIEWMTFAEYVQKGDFLS